MESPAPPDQTHPESDTRGRVQVSVYTTSGSYPRHGFDPEPITATVNDVLEKAKKALHITDTTNWIALVEGREVDPSKSYKENHLSGQIKIQWGPREGGGGC